MIKDAHFITMQYHDPETVNGSNMLALKYKMQILCHVLHQSGLSILSHVVCHNCTIQHANNTQCYTQHYWVTITMFILHWMSFTKTRSSLAVELSTSIPSLERLWFMSPQPSKFPKCLFLTIFGLAMSLLYDLLTSKLNQFIFVYNCIKTVNTVKFQRAVCKILCAQTFSIW